MQLRTMQIHAGICSIVLPDLLPAKMRVWHAKDKVSAHDGSNALATRQQGVAHGFLSRVPVASGGRAKRGSSVGWRAHQLTS